MNKIAIIGSGFLGLTLALRLAEAGNEVTIFESASEIGGLASVWQIGDLTKKTLLPDSRMVKNWVNFRKSPLYHYFCYEFPKRNE